jgi:hypothetical protein
LLTPLSTTGDLGGEGKDGKISMCRMVINVLRSMIIYFPGAERLTDKGLKYVAQLVLNFECPHKY